jgi:hypothetical protein
MRRWVKLLCVAVVLVVLADISLWYAAIGRMHDSWREFIAQSQAAGWSVAAQEPTAEGWPFAARLRAPGLEIAAPDRIAPSGAAFGAETVVAELSLLHPTRLLLRPEGRMHMRLGGLPDTDITAADLRIAVDLASGATRLVADKLVLHAAPVPVPVGHLDIAVRQAPNVATMELDLDGLDLSAYTSRIPADGMVRHLSARTTLAGGVLTVSDLALDWGRIGLTGNATLRADAQGQPEGDGRMLISGVDDALSDLVAAGRITSQNAATARVVLALLQKRQPDGRMMVDLPLGLHNRELTVGQFPVARLPPMPPLLGMSR